MAPDEPDRASSSAAVLGERLRAADAARPHHQVLVTLAAGRPADRAALAHVLGAQLVQRLVDDRILHIRSGALQLEFGLGLTDDVIFVAPDPDPPSGEAQRRDDLLYLGPDSGFLVDAVRQFAPRGERAADLGAGTGVLAAILARTYATVLATDLAPRAVAAAHLTLRLNAGAGHQCVGAVVADGGAGLRLHSFDLVTVNPPWVPDSESDATRRVFADGGPTGAELPSRFLRESAMLLRPGGIAIVLTLDVLLDDGERPIRAVCAELTTEGFTTAMVSTPLARMLPDLAAGIRARQPRIVDAEHVAVVVAAPAAGGALRHRVLVDAEALSRRWARLPTGLA